MKEGIAMFTAAMLFFAWMAITIAFIKKGIDIQVFRALTVFIPLTFVWFKYGKKEIE